MFRAGATRLCSSRRSNLNGSIDVALRFGLFSGRGATTARSALPAAPHLALGTPSVSIVRLFSNGGDDDADAKKAGTKKKNKKKKGKRKKINASSEASEGPPVTSWPATWAAEEDELQRDPEAILFSEDEKLFGATVARQMRSVRKRDAIAVESNDAVPRPSSPIVSPDKGDNDIDNAISIMDYMTASPGSVEDQVGERRAFRHFTDAQRDYIQNDLRDIIDRAIVEEEHIGDENVTPEDVPDEPDIPPTTDWTEMVVATDTVQKVTKGGSVLSFRALVVGGNLRGCGGFGTGKADTPQKAVLAASKMCKRNLTFIDRYKNCALVHDLAGKQNGCIVRIRAVNPGYGMKASETIKHILYYMGVTDACAKAHGNRNPYSVVRAAFKAIRTHRSISDICLARGKRYVSAERAKRLQV
mmetsp:Transcript_30431/g.69665  ORF Transcript_30431/g.69665 Transcript_30431/m.69665 type:complete len:415 (-) Transcript_30431:225-1469(-)